MTDKQVTAILKSQEIMLNKLIALQADSVAQKEALILLLKCLTKFPDGETPENYLKSLVEKSKTELEIEMKRKIQQLTDLLS